MFNRNIEFYLTDTGFHVVAHSFSLGHSFEPESVRVVVCEGILASVFAICVLDSDGIHFHIRYIVIGLGKEYLVVPTLLSCIAWWLWRLVISASGIMVPVVINFLFP